MSAFKQANWPLPLGTYWQHTEKRTTETDSRECERIKKINDSALRHSVAVFPYVFHKGNIKQTNKKLIKRVRKGYYTAVLNLEGTNCFWLGKETERGRRARRERLLGWLAFIAGRRCRSATVSQIKWNYCLNVGPGCWSLESAVCVCDLWFRITSVQPAAEFMALRLLWHCLAEEERGIVGGT